MWPQSTHGGHYPLVTAGQLLECESTPGRLRIRQLKRVSSFSIAAVDFTGRRLLSTMRDGRRQRSLAGTVTARSNSLTP